MMPSGGSFLYPRYLVCMPSRGRESIIISCSGCSSFISVLRQQLFKNNY